MAKKKPLKSHPEFLKGGLNLPKVEEEVLKFWDEHHIFEKSIAIRRAHGKKPFVFYEGPPYANGRPGVHHVLARVFKDIILRYKSMRGYFVPRKAGWDTHGLPVEIAAEKALGLKNKAEIERFGIARFNEEAKKAVWLYKDEWEQMTRRIGYWLDLKNAYVTYAKEYIETIWWSLKRIWERKLLYQGHKVVPWCTRCGTALSSHELAMGYQEVTDSSVYIKFLLKPNQKFGKYKTAGKTYILSWTTTPWTLPGNVALAVGAKISYTALRVKGSSELLILGSDLVDKVFKHQEIEIVHQDIPGKDLEGLSYEPLFSVKSLRDKKSHQVYLADFVTTVDGTGVVHTAVMYGEDDYQLGVKIGLPQQHTVDETGKFTREVKGLSGRYVKAKETEEKITSILKKNKNLLRIEPYAHEYPHCWRCGTPVLYYARTSWFIGMSRLRAKLLSENEKINWVPAHVKEGRFGEWLREAKDWNLSRERFWGAPLPIWQCGGKRGCGHTQVMGSLEDLEVNLPEANNRYILMRHGQAMSNVLRKIDSGQRKFPLTTIGREEVRQAAEELKKKFGGEKRKIDLIISSDIMRTKETAKLMSELMGIKKVVYTKELREIHLGPALSGCHDGKYHEFYPTYESRFEHRPEGGESLRDLRERVFKFLAKREKQYKGKTILVVSHEYPIWMMNQVMLGWSEEESIREKVRRGDDFLTTAEVWEVKFRNLPRNTVGETDLHRPFVDGFGFLCPKCKKWKMERVKEVADVWYDSGAMPFAQLHYPFEHKEDINERHMYPAEYIAEGMDQTRGWFYTLHAIATALGYERAYKNVVSLGLINDKHGQKMSKSKGNIVDPWAVIQKYGVDALRWYFYAATPPGEPKNFDENEVGKTFRKVHLIIYNSLIFYETYAQKNARLTKKPSHVLDVWILHRLQELISKATVNLDAYAIREAALEIERFVDDLSRWYIRRSRRRLQKAENKKDYAEASATLKECITTLVKLMAPFTPFFSEALYANLKDKEESVHLADWPKENKKLLDKKLGVAMEAVRRLSSEALAKRAESGVRVRQPLASLTLGAGETKLSRELIEILKEEANVKAVKHEARLKGGLVLDTVITPALRVEGIVREFTRLVQGLRQEAGLHPKDRIMLMLQAKGEWDEALRKNQKFIQTEVGAKKLIFSKGGKPDKELEMQMEGAPLWIGLRKL